MAMILAAAHVSSPAVVSAQDFTLQMPPQAERKPVPYEVGRGLALFEVEVNGHKVWALLDNGFNPTMLNLAFARSLDLQMARAERTAPTAAGEIEVWRGPEMDLRIPGQMRTRTPSFATDLTAMSALVGRPFSLIFGREYFQVLAVTVTPSDRHIQFAPSGTLGLPADTPYLVLQNNRPQVRALIAGQPVVLTVDLGYNGDIALSPGAWARLGLGTSSSAPNLSVSAAGVISSGAARQVDEVLLGSTSFADVTVTSRPLLPEHGDGLIGFGMLSRFNFAIDINARRLWLISPASTESTDLSHALQGPSND